MSAFPDTPATLLAKIAVQVTGQTNELAWVRFFELYEPAIRKFAEYQGAKTEAEDIAQEILMKLVDILRAGKYSTTAGKFRCYLATLIRRELVSRWRKRQARGGAANVSMDDADAGLEPSVESETAAIIDAKWRLARHEAAVEHAPAKTALAQKSKNIYRAYVLEERPIEEVAAEFGVPRNSVSQVKTRVDKLIAAIESEYAD